MSNNVQLTNNVAVGNLVTHAGTFYADDVFATVLLGKLFPAVRLMRVTRVPVEGLMADAIIFDIGGGKFDHHQKDGNGERSNGVKHAAFGFLWQEYGRQMLAGAGVENAEEVFYLFDRDFVQGIDAMELARNAVEA